MSGPTEGTLRLFARACIADARVWRGAAFYAEVTDRTATEVDLLDERADHLEGLAHRAEERADGFPLRQEWLVERFGNLPLRRARALPVSSPLRSSVRTPGAPAGSEPEEDANMANRAAWGISSRYPDGWCVRVTVGDRTIGRSYAARAGEWELDANGVEGRQLAGTSDVRAPRRNEQAFGRWVRRRLAEEVRDMRAEVERS